MEEIWKPAKGHESRYEVSSKGNVRGIRKGIVLKPLIYPNGYCFVGLYVGENKTKNFLIHRLVAETFIPNPDNKTQVNHKDGNKKNNDISNLEWVTARENLVHAFKIGLKTQIGSKHPNSKLNEAIVSEIKRTYVKGSRIYGCKPLARKYGVNERAIYSIIHHETWTHVV